MGLDAHWPLIALRGLRWALSPMDQGLGVADHGPMKEPIPTRERRRSRSLTPPAASEPSTAFDRL
jgi:hypothetical protein